MAIVFVCDVVNSCVGCAELKFEQMMDKLERSSGQTVVTLNEAKLLLERQDDLVIAVYDYWLNKRLNTVGHYIVHSRVGGG